MKKLKYISSRKRGSNTLFAISEETRTLAMRVEPDDPEGEAQEYRVSLERLAELLRREVSE